MPRTSLPTSLWILPTQRGNETSSCMVLGDTLPYRPLSPPTGTLLAMMTITPTAMARESRHVQPHGPRVPARTDPALWWILVHRGLVDIHDSAAKDILGRFWSKWMSQSLTERVLPLKKRHNELLDGLV